jgi:hypothetical protein
LDEWWIENDMDLFNQGCGSFDMRVLGDKEIDLIGANLRFKIVP